MKKNGKKIIVILGPTASGKSDLAVELAREFNGEVISADSRQVYKGMNIGTGKVPGKWISYPTQNTRSGKIGRMEKGFAYTYKGVPHYCIDYVSPRRIYTAADFKKCAGKAMEEIWSRRKIPIICGGTGFYIQAAIGGVEIPEIKPDWKLRKRLEKKTPEQLFKMLKKLNPERANTIDPKNPRRLIRAIEIAKALGKIPRTTLGFSKGSPWKMLFLGIKLPEKDLKKKIEKRINKMINPPAGGGLVKEVEKLKKSGLSWKRIYELGFEYKYPAMFLRDEIGREEMENKMILENLKYAKRQMTWFRKYSPKTNWVKGNKESEKSVKKFL